MFKQNSIIRFFSLSVSLLVLSVQLVSAGSQVPYKGSAAGAETEREYLAGSGPATPIVNFPNVPPENHQYWFRSSAEAVAHFSQVGKATIDYDWQVKVVVGLDGSVAVITDGTYTVTAANGDTIVGGFQNRSQLGQAPFETTVWVTGGTGRFENATGSMKGAGEFDSATRTFAYDLSGTISSVGSNKK